MSRELREGQPFSLIEIHGDPVDVDDELFIESLPALIAAYLGEPDLAIGPTAIWDVYVSDPDGGQGYLHVTEVSAPETPEGPHFAAKQAVEHDHVLPGHELFIACRVKEHGAFHLQVTGGSKDYALVS